MRRHAGCRRSRHRASRLSPDRARVVRGEIASVTEGGEDQLVRSALTGVGVKRAPRGSKPRRSARRCSLRTPFRARPFPTLRSESSARKAQKKRAANAALFGHSERSIAVRPGPCLAIAFRIFPLHGLGLAPFIDAAALDHAIGRRRRPIVAEHACSQRSDVEADCAIYMMNVRVSVMNGRIHRSLRRTDRHECGYRGGGRAARELLDSHDVAFPVLPFPLKRIRSSGNIARKKLFPASLWRTEVESAWGLGDSPAPSEPYAAQRCSPKAIRRPPLVAFSD